VCFKAIFTAFCQDSSVEVALSELCSRSVDESTRGKAPLVPQQPLLFKAQGHLYAKVDRLAVNVGEVGSFTEAVEFLLMVFYVFNVSFPHELMLFFGFIEHMMGLPLSIGRPVKLTSLISQLAKAVE